MKKTLALLLALLMLGASLVACQQQPTTPPDEEDDGYISTNKDNQNNENDNNNNEGNNEGNNENPGNEGNEQPDNSTNVPQIGAWVEQIDTVYAGATLKLRSSASKASDNNVVKSVPFGTKLNRTDTNQEWSKVSLDGDSQTYYVLNAWLASNNGSFTFTDCTPVDLTINQTSNNIMFFKSPFESEDQNAYYANVICASGFQHDQVSYTSLKKTGVSANGLWIRIEFVGTITIGANNTKTYTDTQPGVLYVKMRSIERGDITDPTHSGSVNDPDAVG